MKIESGNFIQSCLLVTALAFGLASCGGGGGASSPPASLAVDRAPIGMFAVSGAGQVTLSWPSVIGATSYNIYWGTTAGVTNASTKINGATSPYIHSGLTSGSTYYYKVSAIVDGVESLSPEIFSFIYSSGNPIGVFGMTGNMTTARAFHTATLLPNGKVLITGGGATADLYDPATGLFTFTGGMTSSRHFHTATLLPNGKVLVAGGFNNAGVNSPASAELYDPATGVFSATGTFTTTGNMATPRTLHTATLLQNGKVLVTGGRDPNLLDSVELYDPVAGTFSVVGNMTLPRGGGHTATLLPSGMVLIAGGIAPTLTNQPTTATAELYDPATGTLTATGAMSTRHASHSATLLPNGKVLIAGGYLGNRETVYDPATGSFTNTTLPLQAVMRSPTATLLPSGKVLITGGLDNAGTALASAELFE